MHRRTFSRLPVLLTLVATVVLAGTAASASRNSELAALEGALSRALHVVESEQPGFQPELHELVVTRKGGSWRLEFHRLPVRGRVLPHSDVTLQVHDDGQIHYITGL